MSEEKTYWRVDLDDECYGVFETVGLYLRGKNERRKKSRK